MCYTAKCNKLTNSLALDALVGMNKSTVISPLLVRFPLCKLTSVAQGVARSELLSILGIKTNEIQNCYTELKPAIEGLRHMDYLSLNKIILNYTDDVKPQFIANSTIYGIRVDKVGFNYPSLAVSFINRWVDKATYKRLTDLLEPNDITNTTTMIIINAAYLKVTWEIPFDIRQTKDMKFHHLDTKVSTVPMMTKFDDCLYLNDEASHAQYVTMKLVSLGVTMTVVIPQSMKALPQLLLKFRQEPDYLSDVQKRMKFETVKIMMPRFKIKSCLELKEYLQKIGVSQIFNQTQSELNSILKENSTIKSLHLNKVKQKNFIAVDETGIFRQLPRDSHEDMTGRNTGAIEAVCDHPFYFTVNIQADSFNNGRIYHLFEGVYYGPEE